MQDYKYYFALLRQQWLSGDSGFESRAGFPCPVGPTVRRLTTDYSFAHIIMLWSQILLHAGPSHVYLVRKKNRPSESKTLELGYGSESVRKRSYITSLSQSLIQLGSGHCQAHLGPCSYPSLPPFDHYCPPSNPWSR